jgi:hypothetical protein
VALWYRHRPAAHKRLMLLATLLLAGPGFVHLAGYLTAKWPLSHAAFASVALLGSIGILCVPMFWEKMAERRIHPVSLWFPFVFVAQLLVMQLVIVPSPTWQRIAVWLTQ